MKQIKLTQNTFAIVDDEDYPYLSKFKYHVKKKSPTRWYAARLESRNGKQITIYMHMDIMKPKKGFDVDHEDHNGLNNQRYNLRECTHAQNTRNKHKSSNNKSGYKGVIKMGNKWRAKIRQIYLGLFDSPIDAARAYDKKALELFGEYAALNFPD
jgi:hypothetical protein